MGVRVIVAMLGLAVVAAAPADDKVVLGKLGQAVEQTKIYSKPGLKSKVYYTVKPYEYLVINASGGDRYYKVLLQNGQHGYVLIEDVAQLPYDVTAEYKKPTRDTGVGTARSRAAVAQWSTKFTGTPYKWGGNDPNSGIDCSAFMKYLFGEVGVNLPRTAAEQVKVGTPVKRLEDLQPGDRLYFWSSKRNKIGHTGVYLGYGYFCHSSSGKGVATDALTKRWLDILVAARR